MPLNKPKQLQDVISRAEAELEALSSRNKAVQDQLDRVNAKWSKVVESRLEQMRQITKGVPVKASNVMLWVLVDAETERALGVFSDEAKADAAQVSMWDRYRIDTMVEEMVLDELMSHFGPQWAEDVG